jgi:hypothetical protein
MLIGNLIGFILERVVCISDKPETTTSTRAERLAYAFRMYHPPQNGVHLCGISYQGKSGGEFQTIANFPCIDPRGVWESLREFAVPPDEADIVVDFFINGSSGEGDFAIRLQDVDTITNKLAQRGIYAEGPYTHH